MMASENDQLKGIYTKGLGVAGHDDRQRGAKDFVSAPPARQTELLDLIAYRRNQTPELAPGIEFFILGAADDRRRVLHQRDRHQGHRLSRQHAQSTYPAPTEAIAYALKKSGLG